MYNNIYSPAHREIEHIFRELFPQYGLAVREGQISLCHFMLDTMAKGKISLCDAGVGIGKTHSYLVACILLDKFYPTSAHSPIVISTSSVALQTAVVSEYIPFLSHVIGKPIHAVIRKGKERFVCDERLTFRLTAIKGKNKNEGQLNALLSLQNHYDMDTVAGLSSFDKRQVCVPRVCDKSCKRRGICRFHRYLKASQSGDISVQICNHNYLLADAEHRYTGIPPLLKGYRALIIDEAHKLPEAARQMYTRTLSTEDIHELCTLLTTERQGLAAQHLRDKLNILFGTLPANQSTQRIPFILTSEREAALHECISCLHHLQRTLSGKLPQWILHRFESTKQTMQLLFSMDRQYVLYIQYDKEGIPSLCAVNRDIPAKLRKSLWENNVPAILTSGTLMAGNSFDRTREIMGLSTDAETFTAPSPFNYMDNCLLYIPEDIPQFTMGSDTEISYLSRQICRLIKATHGHTLVLFTSYFLMGAVYSKVTDIIPFPLMAVWRNSNDAVSRFKEAKNAVLFSAGSCWEGMDFPGDIVSSLIIPRLPFPVPDPLSEAKRTNYPTLHDYIQSVVVPDMQIKLRQGFGRAIRTETDTCVVSILDYRAAPEERYHTAVISALPECRITDNLITVSRFIRARKNPDYFIP